MKNNLSKEPETHPKVKGNQQERNPWAWVPSLYFAQGIPIVVVMTLSVIMYKRLGVSNTDIALYTSWLYLPWVIKPFWSPFVDMFKTKRYWIVVMQLIIGVGFACIAFTIPLSGFFQYSLAFFWLLAFSSATHDIAADGFYMMGLDQGKQSYFVGIRSTFFRLAMLTGQGLLVILAGNLESATGKDPVNFVVKASQTTEIILPTLPESTIEGDEGFSLSKITEISLGKLAAPYADSIKADIKSRNVSNGFYVAEKQQTTNISGPGFWEKNVSAPLTEFLEKHFSNKNSVGKESKLGNMGIAWLKLNQQPKPGEKIILNLSRESGSADINIIEGTRFEFDESNWNKTAFIVFQIDSKLSKNVETKFIGRSGNISLAWMLTLIIVGIFFVAICIYHRFILPYPIEDKSLENTSGTNILKGFFQVFADFFRKKQIGLALAFLLFYRLAESQLVKLASPFMLDSTELGGLGLTTGQLGLFYGTFGIIALSIGGIMGGILVSRNGLKYWIWWMVAAINLPDLVYVYFSMATPNSYWLIASGIIIETFGYGFGFTAFMMYNIYIAEGKNKTAHYAIATGFMALGMMLPGMLSGWLQEIIGYQNFFIWVMLCTIPGFIIIAFLKIDPTFGKLEKK